jgi:hypothetical protein
VDDVPRVWLKAVASKYNEEPERVGNVCSDDDDADDEEADEAGFSRVAGGDETGEFAAVAVQAVCQEDW